MTLYRADLTQPQHYMLHRMQKRDVPTITALDLTLQAIEGGRIDVQAIALLSDFQAALREDRPALGQSMAAHLAIICEWLRAAEQGPTRGQRGRLEILRGRYIALKETLHGKRGGHVPELAQRIAMAWLALIGDAS